MCASNAAGHGPYSQVYEFRTAYAHPHPVKGKFKYLTAVQYHFRHFEKSTLFKTVFSLLKTVQNFEHNLLYENSFKVLKSFSKPGNC